MEIIFLILGLTLLIIVSIDFLTTILEMGGGGLISNFVTKGFWNLMFVISRKDARSELLSKAGFLMLIVLLLSWLCLIWLACSLIFFSDYDSVVNSASNLPVDKLKKIYFVGYTLSSLGNGDLKAGSDIWRLFTNIVSFYGFFFITLTITFLLPVLDAAIKKRALSAYIYQMGRTPDEIIRNGWNGQNFGMLYAQFTTLHAMILEHTERHLAYPVLHYFHSPHPKFSAPLTLAILDEAITIQETYQLDTSTQSYNWKILRQSINSYLDVLAGQDSKADKEDPPFPYREKISALNFDVAIIDEKHKLDQLSNRRKSLVRLIKRDGWYWSDVTGEEHKQEE